jgi:hypothetical protein
MATPIGDLKIPAESSAAVGYFVDQKKGEVNELKLVRCRHFSLLIAVTLLILTIVNIVVFIV